MTPTKITNKILHIHPLRRCNLRCLHCYSSSSPEEREELEVELLQQAIADASEEGYSVLSVSGGEPMLYQPLEELLATAHRYQMRTSIVSNGILLNPSRLEQLQGLIDIIAISLDGKPELHDRLRNKSGAFAHMVAKLEGLRRSKIPFGFVFTVSRFNFRDLGWAVDFALEQQAKLLHIHLLEEIGRAKENLSGIELNETIAAYVYFQAMKLKDKVGDRLKIHIDLLHQETLRANHAYFYAEESESSLTKIPLAEIVSPLIIETDGTVVPLQHGMARKYALGNLKQTALPQLARQWQKQKYRAFRQLCQQVEQELMLPAELPIKNWYREIFKRAASV
ncbi:radical SAM protein [Myxosarcina sp. GI1]|uniref:radical SAM protein n=1 Tax=Myxosarcina sp. GI1 TaxID=1541065 RepID=UPI0005623A8F|nr:radical SAM protein [Myxosarcina sp. GI1]